MGLVCVGRVNFRESKAEYWTVIFTYVPLHTA